MLIQFTFRSTSPNQKQKIKLIKQTKKKTITVSTASSHTVVNHTSQNGVNWMKTKRNKMSKMSPLQNECQNKTARVCVCVYAFQKDWTTLVQSLVESGCTLTAQVQVDTNIFLKVIFLIFKIYFSLFFLILMPMLFPFSFPIVSVVESVMIDFFSYLN